MAARVRSDARAQPVHRVGREGDHGSGANELRGSLQPRLGRLQHHASRTRSWPPASDLTLAPSPYTVSVGKAITAPVRMSCAALCSPAWVGFSTMLRERAHGRPRPI